MQINKYYDLDFSQRYSSALDILASYLKGQKIIYMEARYHSLVLLYLFTIPSIFLSTFCAVGQYQIDWGFLLSGAVLASLPVILLFVFIGKYFVSGLTEGAVK